MSARRRTRTAAVVGAAAVSLASLLVSPAAATAQPDPQPEVEAQAPELLHNVTYRARVDGVSRGATITYKAEGEQILFANPTMVPGRVFEVMTVLPESGIANMRVSIEWPYSANLHCEILIDDALVAQADDFIAPRVLPQRDDPDYGALTCEAPVGGQPNAAPPAPDALPPDQPLPVAPPT
ncbi:hypothetical protein PDG61_07760 [Mycolicibacterium sp. BiH015]|uniref:hypothetical protein n=1 Tax=Mycolicibacterium sp. BiH015 TaxID=3018808 RepID=UPI0022E9348E|nr:hypothetical protein [Mycolicibacterium sp. BiH015]MDA2890802.1 hypothetical protein [Mycolicibacterium sp. BiH015]